MSDHGAFFVLLCFFSKTVHEFCNSVKVILQPKPIRNGTFQFKRFDPYVLILSYVFASMFLFDELNQRQNPTVEWLVFLKSQSLSDARLQGAALFRTQPLGSGLFSLVYFASSPS
jgi:hypothetical protein